jgi:DNA repair exonuclease SbcCD ATPase subunit
MSETAIEKKKTLFESLPEIGTEVYDQSTNEKIKITESEQLLAVELVNRVARNTIDMARAIHEIRERRAYAQLGCTSFKQFVSDWLPFGTHHAYTLCAIGEKIEPALLSLKASGDEPTAYLGSISMNKYQELLNLDDEQFAKFAKGEEFLTADGRVLTAEEIAKKSVAEIKSDLRDAKKKLNENDAELQKLRGEIEEYRDALSDDASKRGEQLQRIEKLQTKINKLEGERKRGEQAEAAITEGFELIRAGVDKLAIYVPRDGAGYEEDPDRAGMAAGKLAELSGMIVKLQNRFIAAQAEAEGA